MLRQIGRPAYGIPATMMHVRDGILSGYGRVKMPAPTIAVQPSSALEKGCRDATGVAVDGVVDARGEIHPVTANAPVLG